MLIAVYAASGAYRLRQYMDLIDEHEWVLAKPGSVIPGADLVWCDWCDREAVHASRAATVPVVVSLHSFEVFTDFPKHIEWGKVSKLIFVAEHVQERANATFPEIRDVDQVVIPNGVMVPDELPERPRTYRVGIVGGINHKKSPPLIIEACRALHASFDGYTFHWAGKLWDPRYEALFDEAKASGLPLEIEGHVEDMAGWYDDKMFLLNASPWEGNPRAVLEAAAAGCRPFVYRWPGAVKQFPGRWLWRDVRELVNAAQVYRNFVSRSEREQDLAFVRDRYDLRKVTDQMRAVIDGIEFPEQESHSDVEVLRTKPPVAAAMIVRNEAKGLKKCLRSIRGIADEVFIFDTGSTDGTRKIAVAEGAHLFTDPVPESVAGRIHFGDARNVIIGKVPDTFRWILIIDGDEVLTDVGDLRQGLELQDVDALGVRVVSVGDEGAVADQIQARLFRHGRIEYIYPVHNQPIGWEGMTSTTAIIHAHYEGQQSAKAHRSIPILEEQAEADGTNPRWAKLLAQTYLMLAAAENDEAHLRTALVWSRRCRDLAADDARHADNWPRLVRLTAQVAGLEAAEKIAAEGVALFPDLADLRYEQFILTAFAWHGACSVARTKYPLVGQGSLRLAGRLPVAAQALEMPIQFEEA